jgi:tripartite-type tricarboxylate transporter receptor subunit TctC
MRKTLVGGILLAAALTIPLAAGAQDYPGKQIRIVVPYPSGGGVDVMARIIAEKFREKWGQTVTVENRAGGGGNIGTEYVSKASPDGYTLLFVAPGPMVVNKSLFAKLSFDPDAMVAVSLVAAMTNVLAVHPKVAARSMQELIAYAKANPGRLNYATQGIGSVSHLTAELLQLRTGARIVHVPYKGAAPAIADLIGGHLDMGFLELSVTLSHIRAGKLHALALGAEKRDPLLPDVPTMSELLPGLVFTSWYGMVAPPNTPPAIAEKISAAIAEAIRQPDVAQQLRDRNGEPVGSTPAEMALMMKQERERWGNVIRATGLTAE